MENNRVDQALKKNEQYLENIIDYIGDPVFVKDEQSKILLVNDAFCSIFSLSKKDILGKTLAEDVSPEERESFLKIDKQVLSTGIENITEETLTVRGGETKIISTKKTRYIDESGNKFLIGVIRDITERKKAEAIIKESEEKFRTLVQQSADGIFLVDIEGNYLDANESASQMIGYSIDELRKMNASELVLPDNLKQKPLMLDEIKSGKKVFIERNLKRKNGTFIDVEITAKLMDNGKVITTIRDITKRKKAEKDLAESENRLRTILENEPECVKLLDKNGNVVDMNPAGLAMIEAENLEGIKGKKVLQIINEPYRDAFKNLTKNVFEGESGKLEFEITGLKGGSRVLETHAVPFKDPTGQIIYLLGVTRDVTERKNAEKRIIQLNKELEQRVKERTTELETANKELLEVNDLFVGREARIIELKEELEAFKKNDSLK